MLAKAEERVSRRLKEAGVGDEVVADVSREIKSEVRNRSIAMDFTLGGAGRTPDKMTTQAFEGTYDTFFGLYAGKSSSGQYNSFFGRSAGYYSTGGSNTFLGYCAGLANTSGFSNTFVGDEAGRNNTTGSANTASGGLALYYNNTGEANTASGDYALYNNTTGGSNTASGTCALAYNTTNNYNTAFGFFAGYNSRGSFNVYLGHDVQGEAADNNTIRIGLPYDLTTNPPQGQNRTFIAGIVENPMPPRGASFVGITPDGQLGTMLNNPVMPGPRGSVLFLAQGATPPAGYVLLGTCEFTMTAAGSGKPVKLIVNVYQKP